MILGVSGHFQNPFNIVRKGPLLELLVNFWDAGVFSRPDHSVFLT